MGGSRSACPHPLCSCLEKEKVKGTLLREEGDKRTKREPQKEAKGRAQQPGRPATAFTWGTLKGEPLTQPEPAKQGIPKPSQEGTATWRDTRSQTGSIQFQFRLVPSDGNQISRIPAISNQTRSVRASSKSVGLAKTGSSCIKLVATCSDSLGPLEGCSFRTSFCVSFCPVGLYFYLNLPFLLKRFVFSLYFVKNFSSKGHKIIPLSCGLSGTLQWLNAWASKATGLGPHTAIS